MNLKVQGKEGRRLGSPLWWPLQIKIKLKEEIFDSVGHSTAFLQRSRVISEPLCVYHCRILSVVSWVQPHALWHSNQCTLDCLQPSQVEMFCPVAPAPQHSLSQAHGLNSGPTWMGPTSNRSLRNQYPLWPPSPHPDHQIARRWRAPRAPQERPLLFPLLVLPLVSSLVITY